MKSISYPKRKKKAEKALKKKGNNKRGNPLVWMGNRRVMWYREHNEMAEFNTCAHLPEINPVNEGIDDYTVAADGVGFEDDR